MHCGEKRVSADVKGCVLGRPCGQQRPGAGSRSSNALPPTTVEPGRAE